MSTTARLLPASTSSLDITGYLAQATKIRRQLVALPDSSPSRDILQQALEFPYQQIHNMNLAHVAPSELQALLAHAEAIVREWTTTAEWTRTGTWGVGEELIVCVMGDFMRQPEFYAVAEEANGFWEALAELIQAGSAASATGLPRPEAMTTCTFVVAEFLVAGAASKEETPRGALSYALDKPLAYLERRGVVREVLRILTCPAMTTIPAVAQILRVILSSCAFIQKYYQAETPSGRFLEQLLNGTLGYQGADRDVNVMAALHSIQIMAYYLPNPDIPQSRHSPVSDLWRVRGDESRRIFVLPVGMCVCVGRLGITTFLTPINLWLFQPVHVRVLL